MSLRLKLALTIALAALPILWGLARLRGLLDDSAFENAVETHVLTIMDLGGADQLAKAPETWGGPIGRGPRWSQGRGRRHRPPRNRVFGSWARYLRVPRRAPLRGTTIWAYDLDLRSRNPDAPPFPDELRAAVEAGVRVAWTRLHRAALPPPTPYRPDWLRHAALRRDLVACAVRVRPAEGPPVILLLRGDRPRLPDRFWWFPLALCGGLLLVVLLAAGPIVRRIRLLTGDVRHAAADHYETPVAVRGRDEIAKLAAAFNEAGREVRSHVESLEERERTLRRFIGDTTHDVMIPLTVLQGHLTALRKRLETGEGLAPDLLVSALNEAQYVGSILHNLSAVAKLEGGDPQVRSDPVDLNALVERAVARHRPMANAQDISVDYAVPEDSLVARGDVTLLEQAVSNVVHNAVRYNRAGGHVAVLLDQPERDGRFSLRVIDDGPGIDEPELARLPERRFRGAAARTRHPDGLGLGLHIARDVAARHGFDLAFRRSEYGGLEVELSGALLDDEGSAPDARP